MEVEAHVSAVELRTSRNTGVLAAGSCSLGGDLNPRFEHVIFLRLVIILFYCIIVASSRFYCIKRYMPFYILYLNKVSLISYSLDIDVFMLL